MKKLYSKIDIHKRIFEIAWPAVTEQILIGMVGFVSTIFMGRIGTAELAAVGVINMIILFCQTMFTGLATGSTVIIARVTGEGNMKLAKEALIQSLLLGIISGLVITLPAYFFAEPILKFFFSGAEARVLEIGLLYYKIVLIGLPFLVVDLIVSGSVRGSGNTRVPMYITIIVNIINIVMSILLIFGVTINGHVIIPAYGVAGAAVAVNIARISGAMLRIAVIYITKDKLHLTFEDKYTIDYKMMMRVINIGLPAFIEQLILQGGFLAVQIMVISMGTVQSASYQIGQNINSFVLMPVLGFAIATTTIVGQNLGSQNYDEAEIYAFECMKLAVITIGIIAASTFIFAGNLAGLYTEDAIVIVTSMPVVRIFALIDPFLGIMHVSSAVLRSAGDVKYVTISSLIGLWVFRIFTAYIINKLFSLGLYAIMIGVSSDFCVRAMLYGFRVKARKWKTLKV